MIFLWLIFYGTVMLLAYRFTAISPWAMPLGLLVNVAALVGWPLLKKRRDVLGVRTIPLSRWKQHFFFLPYLWPIAYNLASFPLRLPSLPEIIGLLLAATLEEVLFRGLLLPVLCKKNVLTGSVITGLVFAFAHFLNLGTGAGLPFILVQVVYALAIGFSLSGIALSCDSLLPCIGIHFLVNITAGDSLVVSPYLQPLFWAGILLSFICGFRSIYLLKNKPHEERVSYETIH